MKPWTEARNNKNMKYHSKLINQLSFWNVSRKVDYHAGGKWFIHGPKRVIRVTHHFRNWIWPSACLTLAPGTILIARLLCRIWLEYDNKAWPYKMGIEYDIMQWFVDTYIWRHTMMYQRIGTRDQIITLFSLVLHVCFGMNELQSRIYISWVCRTRLA